MWGRVGGVCEDVGATGTLVGAAVVLWPRPCAMSSRRWLCCVAVTFSLSAEAVVLSAMGSGEGQGSRRLLPNIPADKNTCGQSANQNDGGGGAYELAGGLHRPPGRFPVSHFDCSFNCN